MVFQGMGIMPGTALYKIGDLSSIWVIADIYEYELPLFRWPKGLRSPCLTTPENP